MSLSMHVDDGTLSRGNECGALKNIEKGQCMNQVDHNWSELLSIIISAPVLLGLLNSYLAALSVHIKLYLLYSIDAVVVKRASDHLDERS